MFTGETFHTWDVLVADPTKIRHQMPMPPLGVNPMTALDNGPLIPDEDVFRTIKKEEQDDKNGLLVS